MLAAAVVFPPSILHAPPPFLEQVQDSKKLPALMRETLARAIHNQALVALGAASVADIERRNILQASLQAMQRAFARLCVALEKSRGRGVDACLVDGKHAPLLVPAPETITPIVRGDAQSLTIACASIVAKVARDRLMLKLHARYPCYAWRENKGYPVPRHLEALVEGGLSPHHRRTFAPCAAFVETQNGEQKHGRHGRTTNTRSRVAKQKGD